MWLCQNSISGQRSLVKNQKSSKNENKSLVQKVLLLNLFSFFSKDVKMKL